MNKVTISLSKRNKLNLFRHYRKVQTKLHNLTYFFWECTLRCNLNCLHCGSDCLANCSQPDMPLMDFLKVLDEIKTQYEPSKILIAVTGGEPLLRKDLPECGMEFKKRGFPWGMVTNGFLMTPEIYDTLVNVGLRTLTISLDGMEENHNWLRNNKESFKRAISAISYIAEKNNTIFDIVTCVNQRNINELNEIKKLLIEKKVKQWRLFTIFPKGRAKDIKEFVLKNEQLKDIMEFIKSTRIEGTIKIEFSCEGFLGKYEGDVRDGFFFCRAGINVASVLADGSISACPSLRGDYIQGSIYKDIFLDVWNNKFGIMRNREWTKSGECNNCSVYKWCEGNGLHLREESSGKLLYCHYNQLYGEE
jgi:radical SAM enzyme (rSAM/lipoprotein system)